MTSPISLPPAELLRDKFAYNPFTGELFYRNGRKAGTKRPNGYYQVNVEKRIYKQHRIIWKWIYGTDPVGVIDHIDDNPGNNRAWNLQDINIRQNSSRTKVAKTGLPVGVARVKRSKGDKFKSTAYVGRQPYHLGYYETPEAASKAYHDFLNANSIL